MPYISVYEVATFYTMYNLAPVGEYYFQVCTTTPCMIRGAYKLVDVCKKKISENESEISKDGKFVKFVFIDVTQYCNINQITGDWEIKPEYLKMFSNLGIKLKQNLDRKIDGNPFIKIINVDLLRKD